MISPISATDSKFMDRQQYVNLSRSQRTHLLEFRYVAAFRNQRTLKWTSVENP